MAARRAERGSTLLELVVLMSLLGAAAAVSLHSLEDGSSIGARVAAERLARDLRFAQRLSMSRLGSCGVAVDAGTESYRIYENSNPFDPVRDPWTGFDHVVTLDAEEFAGVRITMAVFGIGSSVGFDVEGRPSSGGSVVISAPSGETVTVTLVPETGLVRIAP